MASNAEYIYNFFLSKGLNKYQAAGIVGNWMTESGLDPTNPNPNEHAIGLAQWEGPRRAALQAYARARGTSETDLQTQLDFAWHELTTSYRSVLQATSYMPDAAAVASEIDQFYEVSSGAARQQRMNNAVTVLNAANAGKLASVAGSSNAGGGDAPDGGGSVLTAKPTAADYTAVDGLKAIVQRVPELRNILNNAISTGQGVAEFQDAIEASKWWKSNSDKTRQLLIQQVNDPATYNSNLSVAEQRVMDQARQMGITPSAAQVRSIAFSGLSQGLDSDSTWLAREIGGTAKVGAGNPYANQGQMAQVSQQLLQLGNQYGHHFSNVGLQTAALHVVEGATTLDTYKQSLMNSAISAFPGLADQLKGGMTLQDLASPYVQSMSNILELNPNSLNVFDPTIRRALQGTAGAGKGSIPQAQPIWQFENTLRADPRWQTTQNAKDTVSTALTKVGTDWGFL